MASVNQRKLDRIQPAKKSYFFGKGYQDLWNTIKGAFRNIWKTTDNNGDTEMKFYTIAGCALHLKYAEGGITRPFRWLYWLVLLISVAVCGTIVTALVSLIHIVVLFCVMAVIYVLFSIIWLIDRIYLAIKKISTVCPNCDEHYLIPTYICSNPNCGAKHTRLTPGVYGILRRRCECGEKLPTTFLNGRNKLQAECPQCGYNIGGSAAEVSGKQVCIPVVGGPSVGKTTFITAFSHDFIEKVSKRESLEIEFLNPTMQKRYSSLKNHYEQGTCERTVRESDRTKVSSIDLSFKVKGKGINPQRVVHLYDISGEVFADNSDEEVLRLYRYTHGLVIVIDPFSIPDIMEKYGDGLSPVDKKNVGMADMSTIIDTFMNKLREATGLADKDMAKIPAAVVINKGDSANLMEEIGLPKAKILQKTDAKKFDNLYDTEDYLCRKFLHENGLDNVLTLINNKFRMNRYFVCSPVGHSIDSGKYAPVGVMPAMEWLMKEVDGNGIGSVWDETEFTKEPFALKKGFE